MMENENIQIAIGNLTAIKLICKKFENAEETIDLAIKALEKVQQFEAIGTVEEFKDLKEKSLSKKPLHQGFVFACPCCNDKITVGSVFLRPNQKCCIDCGTEFDWQ